jgi:hypothetical protein
MNQHNIILNTLQDSQWHCSNQLRDLFVPEYRSRINELRKRGYTITKERCKIHNHKGITQMWKLVATPEEMKNYIMPEITAYTIGEVACCYSFAKFKVHDSKCQELVAKKVNQLF